jgi:riboflavin synthase
MFTGIIETTAKIDSMEYNPPSLKLQRASKNIRIAIELSKKWKIKIGESIAVSGVCLTVSDIKNNLYFFDIIPETLSKTTFGKNIYPEVNIERSLVYGARVHGHLVSGHVDCVGKVVKVIDGEDGYKIEISYPKKFKKYIISKGSITVDGVSLTVAQAKLLSFVIAIIPHTLKITTLSNLEKGDFINLEFDNKKYVTTKY